jgi:TPR repeat protein
MYYLGQGVKKNKIKAYQYLMKSAQQGNSVAQNRLDILCKESPWACK